MAEFDLNWDEEFNPYLDFTTLPAGNFDPTFWVVPNRTSDSNAVKTFTVFGGEGLTFDDGVGGTFVPTGGTITSVTLMVFNYASGTLQTLTSITNVEINAAEFGGYIAGVNAIHSAVEAVALGAGTWLDVIVQDDPVIDTNTTTQIILENSDGTFTEFVGTDLSIGPDGVSGELTAINLLDTDVNSRAVLTALDLGTVLASQGFSPGDPVEARAVIAAIFDDDASPFFYRLFNEGDGTVVSIANAFSNGIGDIFHTTIIDGLGSDTIINDTGFTGVSYQNSAAITAFLGDFNGLVGSADGLDTDTLINVRRLFGSEGDDVINASAMTLHAELFGDDGNDQITGGSGNDDIEGGAGDDVLDGGAGIDRASYYFAESGVVASLADGTASGGGGADTLANIEELEGSAFADTLTGDENDNFLISAEGDDTISGGDGDDYIDGEDGLDTMAGGEGDDTFILSEVTDVVNENANEGIDEARAQSSGNYALAANVENLTLYQFNEEDGTAGDGTGNALNNVIRGNTFDNTLTGLAGDDTYYVQDSNESMIAGDVVVEAANGGNDRIKSSVSFINASNVEVLELIGTENINATGTSANETLLGNTGINTITGNGGNDFLFAGADGLVDTLLGGMGNDIYLITAPNDAVIENDGEGTDTVRFAGGGTYTLTEFVERLELQGASASNGTGNALNNTITGNTANNVLMGMVGNDTLSGLAGNDTLNGGAGKDTMIGGAGNDVYVVDDANDATIETANNGTDAIQTALAWTLKANTENLTLTGAAAVTGTGNGLANTLNGATNTGANVLRGLANNDLYIIGVGDVVDETFAGSGGTDSVQTALLTYTLTANVENLAYTGAGNFIGTGNASNNTITGASGNDTLSGLGGADSMTGFAGNDIYIVDAGDIVTEAVNGGTDTIRTALTTFSLNTVALANVENLTYTGALAFNGTGNALNNVITGGSAANTLTGLAGVDTLNGMGGADILSGGDGNDTLFGGLGNDSLTGGLNNDTFVFNTALNAATNRDTISDFNVAADTMQLENAIFTAILGTGTLTAAQFRAGAGAVALDADDRVIYNSTTGALSYDSNGNVAGGSVQFATLAAGLALTNADFVII